MSTFKIDAELRDDMGKGASRRLRHDNKVPAIIYGAKKDPRAISLNHLKVLRYIEDETFFTSVIELKAAGGKRQKVILRDMQRHPSKPVVLHMDFQRIDDNVLLHMNIPLHFANEEDCPAAKLGGVIVSHLMTEVEIACLPGDLPDFIEIDLTGFDDGDFIRLSDIKLPKGVTLTAFTHGDDEEHDEVVVATTHVHAEVEETTEEVEAPSVDVPTAQDEKKNEED